MNKRPRRGALSRPLAWPSGARVARNTRFAIEKTDVPPVA